MCNWTFFRNNCFSVSKLILRNLTNDSLHWKGLRPAKQSSSSQSTKSRDILKTNQTAANKPRNLFSTSDDDDEDLFNASVTKADVKAKGQQPAKSKSLFENSDSDGEDLFGGMTKAKPIVASSKLRSSDSSSSVASQGSKSTSQSSKSSSKPSLGSSKVTGAGRSSNSPAAKTKQKLVQKDAVFDGGGGEKLLATDRSAKTPQKQVRAASKEPVGDEKSGSLFSSKPRKASRVSKNKDPFSVWSFVASLMQCVASKWPIHCGFDIVIIPFCHCCFFPSCQQQLLIAC